MKQEQPEIPISVGNSSAGFAVGAQVGELVIAPKSFSSSERANAAGQVELLPNDILPNGIDGVQVALVARESGDIRHAAVEVARPHGMADGFSLFHRLHARLMIIVPPVLA